MFGPVIVIEEPETLVTDRRLFAGFVISVAVQLYVAVEVKAGLMPVIVTTEGVPDTRAALPCTICPLVMAVAEQVDVVPQACTLG